MMEIVVAQIETDLQKNFIAVWHDESHLNRFFIDHLPTKILSPSYCYPENAQNYRAIWHLKRKLVALDKNHNEVRK
jgi:histo-blood group ABO system transferase